MSKIGLSGSIESLDRASGGPDAPISPIFSWTRAFGPVPIRVQEGRTRPWTARSMLIRENPGSRRLSVQPPGPRSPPGGDRAATRLVVRRDEQVSTPTSIDRVPGPGARR